MRKTRRDNFLINNLIYVIVGILVIVLLVLILGKVFGSSGNGSNGNGADASIDVSKVKKELKKDVTPELQELVEQYYTAMSSCDITTLEQIVSEVSDDDRDIIRRKKDYIEGYNNVTVYSKKSSVKGCYLVYADYDIKFKNEDTLVPGLETFYVRTSKEGNLYIFKGDKTTLDKKEQDFIDDELSSANIKALFSDVDNQYVDALASSPTLLSFIEGFEGNNELVEKAKEKAKEISAKASDKPAETQEPEASDEPTETSKPTEEPTQEPAAEPEPTQEPAQDTTETVLVTANVNLRSGNDEGAERLTTMIVGDQATRVSITDNGWSKVQYNGMEGYVKSDYVSTFKITSDTVHPTTTINVRLEASETANMAGQCSPDMGLTRYAVCDNGWSQVQFNGGVGYVKTEFLTN